MRYLLGLTLLLAVAIPSRADSFSFTFTSSTFSGSGLIEASQLAPSPSLANLFVISSLSGMMNGQAISMTANTQGIIFHRADDSWGLDPTGSGVYFTDAGGTSWSLFLFSQPIRNMLVNNAAGGFRTEVQLSIVRISEPSTLAMIAVGLALATLLFRRSARRSFSN